MNAKKKVALILAGALALASGAALATGAVSGVRAIQVQIPTGWFSGLTREQQNVKDRLQNDNRVGAVKHLYVIAPKSGQVLLYSTVKGKVTSGSKRISPGKTLGFYKCGKDDTCFDGFRVKTGNGYVRTTEVLGDDGSYGSSAPYIYWWDVRGVYHQHFLTDGQIIQISDQPLAVRSIVLNIEATQVPAR